MSALQLTYAHRGRTPEADGVRARLEQIVREHAKAKVDRIVHCVFALSLGTVSGGFQSFTRDEMPDRLYENTPAGFQALEDAGYDFVQVLLESSHRNGMEFLGGLRMNDRHRPSTPFHAAHPEWQLAEYPGAMDYQHAGVRDAVLGFIDEFLARYNVDGLELDWMRWGPVFRPTEAAQNAPLLNDFIQAIRERLERAAAKRGHGRLWLGVRVPQTLPECRALGFDVAAWIRSGQVDYVCPSDFFFTDFNTRTEDFVRLAEGTRCRIYPSLHPLISSGNDHQVQSRESYRAAANNFIGFGAHGVSAYNYQYHWRTDKGREDNWPGVMDYLTGVRELADIRRGDRRYLFHPMWQGHDGDRSPTGARQDVRIVLGLILGQSVGAAGGSLDLRLAEDAGSIKDSATLEFKATGLEPNDELAVIFSGGNLSDRPHQRRRVPNGQSALEGRVLPAFDLFHFPLQSTDVKFGDNRLTVHLRKKPGTGEVVIQEIEVFVPGKMPGP